MKTFYKHILFLFLFGYGIMQSSFAQFTIAEKPNFIPAVVDSIGLLNRNEYERLSQKLIQYNDTTSTEVFVAIIGSTKGQDIGYLATQWAHKWKIGKKGKDNGIVMLLAKDDRKITIRTGYGTEHLMTDYTSKEIIEYLILPYFKKGQFYAGLDSGTNAIFEVMQGAYKGVKNKKTNDFDVGFIVFIIIIIIFFILVSKGNNGKHNSRRSHRRNGDILDTIILSNMGRGSYSGGGLFGGSGSSGGGFGGFGGGGDFGGGGATGGW